MITPYGRLPAMVPVAAEHRYMLAEPWSFRVEGYEFTVPAGYLYDGASIPRGGWYTTYSPFNPVVMVAALEHDYLCDRREHGVPTHVMAAEHFRDRLTEAAAWKRALMYRAVLYFGPEWGSR